MAARTEGMASRDSLQAQPTAFDQPVLLDSLQRVLGARRRVPASRRHPSCRSLIKPNEGYSDRSSHRFRVSSSKRPISSWRIENSSASALLLHTTTKSRALSGPNLAIADFTRRLTRFLRGFDPIWRLVATPNWPDPKRERSRKLGPATLAPSE